MTRYIIRDEKFGATVYDKRFLQYQLVSHEKLRETMDSLERNGGIQAYWNADTSNCRADILYSPIRIYFELTLKCNLRCKLCFNSSGAARQQELSTDQIIEILSNMREANVLDIRFTGGEITQHPDWYRILWSAKQLGFAVSCNTNGVFENSTVVEQLLNLYLDQITISIDGTKGSHERNRGIGTYDKTIDSLKALSEGGAHLRINTLISRWNLDKTDEVLSLAARYAEEINFFPFRPLGRGKPQACQSISLDDYYEMGRRALDQQEKYPGLRILHFARASKSRSIDLANSLGLKAGSPDGFTCFNVSSDGKLWAGGYAPYIDPNCYMGHALEDGILTIWQQSAKLDRHRHKSCRLKRYCAHCPEYPKRCPGAIFEIEQMREMDSTIRNPFCIHETGPSLFEKL